MINKGFYVVTYVLYGSSWNSMVVMGEECFLSFRALCTINGAYSSRFMLLRAVAYVCVPFCVR